MFCFFHFYNKFDDNAIFILIGSDPLSECCPEKGCFLS